MRHEKFTCGTPLSTVPAENNVLGRFADGMLLEFQAHHLTAPHTFVQGRTGSGKTSAVCRMVEAAHDQGIPCMVVDPEGQYAPLRQSCPGTLVIGGTEADVPLSLEHVAAIVTEALRNRASFVLQIDEFPLGEQREIVAAALGALMAIPQACWHKRLIIIDEVHLFAPQRGTCESAGPIAEVAARGRRRGYYLILATQRFARVSKDCITQCGNVLIGLNRDPADLKPAADALGFTSREIKMLATLPRGTFMASGPDFSEVAAELRMEKPRTRLGGTLSDNKHPLPVLTGETRIDAVRRAGGTDQVAESRNADPAQASLPVQPADIVPSVAKRGEGSEVDLDILSILATARSRVTLPALAVLLRGKRTEKTITGAIMELRRRGLAAGRKHLVITEAGRKLRKSIPIHAPTVAELIGDLRRQLHPDTLRVLDGLSAVSAPLAPADIAERTGFSARSRKLQQHLAALSRSGLVKRRGGRFSVSVGYDALAGL